MLLNRLFSEEAKDAVTAKTFQSLEIQVLWFILACMLSVPDIVYIIILTLILLIGFRSMLKAKQTNKATED